MDWNKFSAIGRNEITSFRKELFSEIFYSMWRTYKDNGDEKVIVSVFIRVMNDFPDLKDLFDKYYAQYTDDNVIWSDRKIILRFFQKLLIILDNIEIKNAKV